MTTLIELQQRREIHEQLRANGSHTCLSVALPVHWGKSLFQSSAMESLHKDCSCQH